MNIIIADDFTGASDSAIKFKENNIESKVVWDIAIEKYLQRDILVSLDLDTRNISGKDSYEKTKYIFKQLKNVKSRNIFKKIDSTLRGNIGIEIDAMLDNKDAEFIVVIPSYPNNFRYLKDGRLYVGDILLENTYFYNDVLLPYSSSEAKEIISYNSKYKVKNLSNEDIHNNFENAIDKSLKENVRVFVCDAETNQDIQKIYNSFNRLSYDFIWSGSAGLAETIAKSLKTKEGPSNYQFEINNKIVVVLGSTNKVTRNQLNALILKTDIYGIEVEAHKLLDPSEVEKEIRGITTSIINHLNEGKDVVVFTAISEKEKEKLNNYKLRNNLNDRQLGKKISDKLGEIIYEVNINYKLRNLIMSGGDTAKSIAESLSYKEYQLFFSIEEGMPLGILSSNNSQITSVTKAGGFGVENSLIKAYITLGGHLKDEYQRDSTSYDYANKKQSGN